MTLGECASAVSQPRCWALTHLLLRPQGDCPTPVESLPAKGCRGCRGWEQTASSCNTGEAYGRQPWCVPEKVWATQHIQRGCVRPPSHPAVNPGYHVSVHQKFTSFPGNGVQRGSLATYFQLTFSSRAVPESQRSHMENERKPRGCLS